MNKKKQQRTLKMMVRRPRAKKMITFLNEMMSLRKKNLI